MSEMIERVAKALHAEISGSDPDELIHHPAQNSWDAPNWPRWRQWEEAARAAIGAMRKPTSEMWIAGQEANRTTIDNAMRGGGTLAAWSAMIDEALK